jgi:site-specific recombinase XerD
MAEPATLTPDLNGAPDALSLTRHEVARIVEAVDAAYSANTLAAYRSAWKGWQAWANQRGANVLPAEPPAVAAFLASRADRGARMPTIRLAVAAIGVAHRQAGHDNPCTHDMVRQTVKGLSRQAADAGRALQRQAAALDGEALAAIRATACLPRQGPSGRTESAAVARQRGLVDVAMCAVMGDGGLRRSEAAALKWEDVQRADDGSGRLTIRRSKTDVVGEGAVVALTRSAMQFLDAIRQGAGAEAPVFGLSASQIHRRLKAAAKAAGLGDGFSGHSGRVGMATRMTRLGAPMPVVMRQGR